MPFQNDFPSFGLLGIPVIAQEFYNLMTAHWIDTSRLVNNGLFGYDPLSTGPFTNYVYSGDPGSCDTTGGWTEVSAGNTPGERHMVASHCPFVFAPGQKATLDYALVFARDPAQDNLGNVCRLFDATDAVRSFWDATDKSCWSIVLERPQPATDPLSFRIHPNPAGGIAHITLSQPASGHSLLITELNGRMLQRIPLPLGAQTQQLDLTGLANGVYILSLEGETGLSTQRLSVLR